MLPMLGKYQLDAPLGAGGMAEVFRAHTQGVEGFRRPVAIKRILSDASRNPAFAEMFIAEAKLSSRLQHPNIVSVLDFDRDADGRLYLVMELVEGRDLDQVLGSGRLPLAHVVYIVTEVLRGLGYAHDLPGGDDSGRVRGLIHRDISPHNVLCAWNGAVKVSDFGIAKARAATAASASIVIKGKPAYMSPEQINGAPLDGRSDLFAVGVMLWQMLTGQHLFALGTTTETLARVLFAPVPCPSALAADVPGDLDAVTMKLLARNPAQRYPTAEDAIDDLLRCKDAPLDGRRELERLLIERFPRKAPVRRGKAQEMMAEGTPGPSSGPGGAVGAMGPGGTMALPRSARSTRGDVTRTAGGAVGAAPAVVPRRPRVAIAVAVAIALALIAGVAVAGLRGLVGSGGAAPRDAADDAAIVDAAAVIDAVDAAVDAGVDAATRDAGAATTDARARKPRVREDGPRRGIHEIELLDEQEHGR